MQRSGHVASIMAMVIFLAGNSCLAESSDGLEATCAIPAYIRDKKQYTYKHDGEKDWFLLTSIKSRTDSGDEGQRKCSWVDRNALAYKLAYYYQVVKNKTGNPPSGGRLAILPKYSESENNRNSSIDCATGVFNDIKKYGDIYLFHDSRSRQDGESDFSKFISGAINAAPTQSDTAEKWSVDIIVKGGFNFDDGSSWYSCADRNSQYSSLIRKNSIVVKGDDGDNKISSFTIFESSGTNPLSSETFAKDLDVLYWIIRRLPGDQPEPEFVIYVAGGVTGHSGEGVGSVVEPVSTPAIRWFNSKIVPKKEGGEKNRVVLRTASHQLSNILRKSASSWYETLDENVTRTKPERTVDGRSIILRYSDILPVKIYFQNGMDKISDSVLFEGDEGNIYSDRSVRFKESLGTLLYVKKLGWALRQILDDNPGSTITVEGHASWTGRGERNFDLAERRASWVKEQLLEALRTPAPSNPEKRVGNEWNSRIIQSSARLEGVERMNQNEAWKYQRVDVMLSLSGDNAPPK